MKSGRVPIPYPLGLPLIASAEWQSRAICRIILRRKRVFETRELKHHVRLQSCRFVDAQKIQSTVREQSQPKKALSHARRKSQLTVLECFPQVVKSMLELRPSLGRVHWFNVWNHGRGQAERVMVPSWRPSISYTQPILTSPGSRKAARLIARKQPSCFGIHPLVEGVLPTRQCARVKSAPDAPVVCMSAAEGTAGVKLPKNAGRHSTLAHASALEVSVDTGSSVEGNPAAGVGGSGTSFAP